MDEQTQCAAIQHRKILDSLVWMQHHANLTTVANVQGDDTKQYGRVSEEKAVEQWKEIQDVMEKEHERQNEEQKKQYQSEDDKYVQQTLSNRIKPRLRITSTYQFLLSKCWNRFRDFFQQIRLVFNQPFMSRTQYHHQCISTIFNISFIILWRCGLRTSGIKQLFEMNEKKIKVVSPAL